MIHKKLELNDRELKEISGGGPIHQAPVVYVPADTFDRLLASGILETIDDHVVIVPGAQGP